MRSPLEPIAPTHCICGGSEDECACCDTEKALRWVGWCRAPLAPEQREWCLRRIHGVEGYDRKHYERESDAEVAKGVLHSMADYCRDKGIFS